MITIKRSYSNSNSLSWLENQSIVRKPFILSTLVLFAFSAFAVHDFGTEITYRCLSPGVYEFSLHKNLDCSAVPFPPTQTLSVHSNSCNIHFNALLHLDTVFDVSPLCPSVLAQSTCNGGNLPGQEHYIFKDTLTLTPCVDWLIYYQQCCRSNVLTNFQQPANASYYVETRLNNLLEDCNNSPILHIEASHFLGVGHQVFLSPGAYDQDGDSLYFELVAPMEDSATSLGYLPPYNPMNPLGTAGGFHFDEKTGQMRFTPNVLEVTIVTLRISEFRNDQFLGSMTRDFMLWIINDAGNPNYPIMVNASPQNNETVEADSNCFVVNVGDTMSLGMFAFDNDPPDSMSSWFYAPPGVQISAFSHQAFAGCTADLTWVPQASDAGHWYFTKRVHDNACPMYGQGVRTVKVTVRNPSVCNSPAALWSNRISPTTVRLNWDTVQNAHYYILRGRPVGGTHWLHETQQPFLGYFQANGLNPNTEYEWQIKTGCSLTPGDTSNWTGSDTFTTGCYPVDTTWTDPVTSNAARLNWRTTNFASAYEIKGKRVGTSFWTTLFVPFPLSHKDVFGLQPQTSYEWTIRVWCDTGGVNKSPWYPLNNFTTSNFGQRSGSASERKLYEQIEIFPNPVENQLTISLPQELDSGNLKIRLFGLNGGTSELNEAKRVAGQVIVKTSHLPQGIYQLQIEADGYLLNRKIVKMR